MDELYCGDVSRRGRNPFHLLCTPCDCWNDNKKENDHPGPSEEGAVVSNMAEHLLSTYGLQVVRKMLAQIHPSTPVIKAMRCVSGTHNSGVTSGLGFVY